MTSAEIAAVLCGLRVLQAEIEKYGEPLAKFMDIFTSGGELAPLTAAQIDRLCERITMQRPEHW